MKNRIILYLIVALTSFSLAQAQKLKVDKFVLDAQDLSAQAKPRNDLNGELCALVKVQLASDKAEFSGDIVEPAPEYKVGEYWLYMTGKDPEARYLKVFVPGYLPLDLDFTTFKDVGQLKSGLTYVLTIEIPAPQPEPSERAPSSSTQSHTTQNAKPVRESKNTLTQSIYSTQGAEMIQSTPDKVYESVEVMPTYPGGDAGMNKIISNNLVYPPEAIEEGIQGRVVVKFVVTKDGSIEQVQIVRGCHPALDKEAMRVVKKLGRFNPGKHNGENVSVWFSLPITFKRRF